MAKGLVHLFLPTVQKIIYSGSLQITKSLARENSIPLHNNVSADSESAAWDKFQECPVSCSYYISCLLKEK